MHIWWLQYGNASLAESERESGVTYQVRLTNGYRVRVHVFVVYDEAVEVSQPGSQASADKAQKLYRWPSVSRAQCKKGCQVPRCSNKPTRPWCDFHAIHGPTQRSTWCLGGN